MSFFSRLFSNSKAQNLPGLLELLEARGVPADLPGLDDDLLAGFDALKARERESTADAIASLHKRGLPLPQPWSKVQYELLPQIVTTWQGEREQFHYRPCFDNLCKRVLADGKPVVQEWFAIWDIHEDYLLDLALDHLEERTRDKPFVRLSSGIYRSDFGDGLDASRILLPQYWNNLFPGQNTFIAIPRQGLLLVAPQVLLPKLVEAIGEAMREAGPDVLVLTMYQWVDSKLMPASLQDPHPMIQPQREFRQMDAMAAYSAQAEDLAKMQIGVPCPIGILRTQQGRTLTMATWVEGKPALAPDSDLIGFVSSRGKPLGLYWRQTLPRLQRIKGEPVDIWGPRRLVFKDFPTVGELEELECFAPADVHAQVLNPQAAQQGRPAPDRSQAQQSQQSHAASASAMSNSPVPAHLRGLSLGVQSDD
ncbi:MAG: hypothetical protein LBQ86_05140 [Holophagales bacterium]|jgi:hypothetical protein|nr:hypothetical protein [Holophagales bacterium]